MRFQMPVQTKPKVLRSKKVFDRVRACLVPEKELHQYERAESSIDLQVQSFVL